MGLEIDKAKMEQENDVPSNGSPTYTGLSDMDPKKFVTFGSLFILAIDSLLFPLDTIKTIIMADRRKKAKIGVAAKEGVWKLTRRIWKKEGITRFWRGIMPSVIGSFPGQAW